MTLSPVFFESQDKIFPCKCGRVPKKSEKKSWLENERVSDVSCLKIEDWRKRSDHRDKKFVWSTTRREIWRWWCIIICPYDLQIHALLSLCLIVKRDFFSRNSLITRQTCPKITPCSAKIRMTLMTHWQMLRENASLESTNLFLLWSRQTSFWFDNREAVCTILRCLSCVVIFLKRV